MSTDAARRPPPRALVGVAVVVNVVAVVMVLQGAWSSGVSWDETYHVQRMQNFLDHGWFIIDSQVEGGRPGSWVIDEYVYGPATMILLHAWTWLVGGETWSDVAVTERAYALRHLGVALLALLGVFASAVITRIVLRSWGWGVVGGAVLMSIPMWTGHSMFNPKDISVASGLTWVTLGLMMILRAAVPRWFALVGMVLVFAGSYLTLGTRPGMWAAIAASCTTALVLAALGTRSRQVRPLSSAAALVSGPLLAAAVGLLVMYPAAFGTPGRLLVESASASSDYAEDLAGFWWYVPVSMAVSIPVLALVSGAIGTFGGLRTVLGGLSRPDREVTDLALVGVQTLTLPLVAIVMEASLYNGLRHLMFAVPTAAVLCTVGLNKVLDAEAGRERSYRAVVAAVIALGLLGPVASQIRLFPYNYTYSNVIAEGAGLEPDTDWWWTSAKELAAAIPSDEFVSCVSKISDDGMAHPVGVDLSSDCAVNPIGTLAPYRAAFRDASEVVVADTQFLMLAATTADVGTNCRVIDTVERPRVMGTALMGYVAVCEVEPHAITKPVLLREAGAEQVSILEGWYATTGDAEGLLARIGTARLVIAAPADWVGERLRLTLSGRSSDALEGLSVNGVRLEPRLIAAGEIERIAVMVPGELTTRYEDGRLVVAVDTEAVAQGNFELRRLDLAEVDR